MKKQVQELSAAVVAVQEALSSVLHMLTPIKDLVSTMPVIQAQVQQLSLKLLCRCEESTDITGEEEYICSICKKDHKQCYLCAGDCFPGCSKETKQLRGR